MGSEVVSVPKGLEEEGGDGKTNHRLVFHDGGNLGQLNEACEDHNGDAQNAGNCSAHAFLVTEEHGGKIQN